MNAERDLVGRWFVVDDDGEPVDVAPFNTCEEAEEWIDQQEMRA